MTIKERRESVFKIVGLTKCEVDLPYDIDSKLMIGLASSALFDLDESDRIFREEGEDVYRDFQKENQKNPLKKGVAFQFIERLLSVNEVSPDNPPIEVVLMSRNDPDTGLRVMNSIKTYGLNITRAIFRQGRPVYEYIDALNICLFLSGDAADVRQAILAGHPAGTVLGSRMPMAIDSKELRLAFDFDGVIADDEAESIFQAENSVEKFHSHESKRVDVPHSPGPLKDFLEKLSKVQRLETDKARVDSGYEPKIRISIVSARNAPSHERVINTMRAWNIKVNEAFFLGGIEKKRVLKILQPHIFFDDQKLHLEPSAQILPSVHIPFGIRNDD